MARSEVYTAALLDHNNNPDYKYQIENATYEHEGINPSCGDDITISLKTSGDAIDEAAFTGHGCAVSQASADIMADLITDKSCEDAHALCDLFLKMIRGEVTDDEELAPLGEAAQLKGIAHMPARVKCAELAWRTCMQMLEERDS